MLKLILETKKHWDSSLNTRPNEVPTDSEYPECESKTVSRERAVPCYVLGASRSQTRGSFCEPICCIAYEETKEITYEVTDSLDH